MIETQVQELLASGRRDQALALLLGALRRKVFRLAFSYLRDRDAAEDVAQEVFIKVWHALPRFDGRASLSTWIYTISRNTSLSALRRRRNTVSLDDAEIASAVDEVQSIDDSGAASERAALLRLVDQLPDRQRQVLMLFYMEDRSHEEVARMLAMPIGTVKTLLHRGRARLALHGTDIATEAV